MKYYYKKFDNQIMKVSVDKNGEIVGAEMITAEQLSSSALFALANFEALGDKTQANQILLIGVGTAEVFRWKSHSLGDWHKFQ